MHKTLLVPWDQNRPFAGDSFIKIPGEDGVEPEVAKVILMLLYEQKVFTSPHPTEVSSSA